MRNIYIYIAVIQPTSNFVLKRTIKSSSLSIRSLKPKKCLIKNPPSSWFIHTLNGKSCGEPMEILTFLCQPFEPELTSVQTKTWIGPIEISTGPSDRMDPLKVITLGTFVEIINWHNYRKEGPTDKSDPREWARRKEIIWLNTTKQCIIISVFV